MKKKSYLIILSLVLILIFGIASICNLCGINSAAVTSVNESEDTEEENTGNSATEESKASDATQKQDISQVSSDKNSSPVINSINVKTIEGGPVAIDQITPGEPYLLTCNINDTDNNTISYKWSTDGGSLDDPSKPSPIWTTPMVDETYHISLEVSDGKGGTDNESIAVRVLPPAEWGEIRRAEDVFPVINDIVIIESPIYTETAYEITAWVEGLEPLEFSFSAESGILERQFGNTIYWTTPSDPGTYTITVAVKDVNGNTTGANKDFTVESKWEEVN